MTLKKLITLTKEVAEKHKKRTKIINSLVKKMDKKKYSFNLKEYIDNINKSTLNEEAKIYLINASKEVKI